MINVHGLLVTFLHKYLGLFIILLQGEYRLNIEKVYPCDPSNYTFQFNCFLSKKTLNTYELKGNITFLKSFDDTLKVSVILY